MLAYAHKTPPLMCFNGSQKNCIETHIPLPYTSPPPPYVPPKDPHRPKKQKIRLNQIKKSRPPKHYRDGAPLLLKGGSPFIRIQIKTSIRRRINKIKNQQKGVSLLKTLDTTKASLSFISFASSRRYELANNKKSTTKKLKNSKPFRPEGS